MVIDPNAAMGDLSPIIRAAATGDLDAQRNGRDRAFHDMKSAAARGDALIASCHAAELMFWSRLAASHGHQDDAVALCSSLAYLAEYWTADDRWSWYGDALLAETAALLDKLAAAGNEAAADSLNHLASNVRPEILQQAKEIA
jgi:hypothetical protein